MEDMIYQLVSTSAYNNPSAVMRLIEIFSPKLNLCRSAIDGDDMRQELEVFLIDLIKKPSFKNISIKTDAAIIAYIAKSLKNHYFFLLKNKYTIHNPKACPLPADIPYTVPYAEHLSLKASLKKLTQKEYSTIILLYFYGYSVKEVAARAHTSVQAVYQARQRILRKLRNLMAS
jgi:DNA-directed RNA polymerase specialized sigma24 family protein